MALKHVAGLVLLLALDGTGSFASAQGTNTAFVNKSNPASVQECFPHVKRCTVVVYVHKNDPAFQGRCSTYIDPDLVKVRKPGGGAPTKIVWILRAGDASTNVNQFEFRVQDGVTPIDGQQPTNLFTSEGHDNDTEAGNNGDDMSPGGIKRRFRWKSTHTPGNPQTPVHYKVNVIRTAANPPELCEPADPTINNFN